MGGRVVKVHVRMARQPSIALRFVRGQVVEDHVDLIALIKPHHTVHEVEELQLSAAFVMPSRDLAGCHLERGKQGRGPVSLVVMRAAVAAGSPTGFWRMSGHPAVQAA